MDASDSDHPATIINALVVQKSYLLRSFADERISITEKVRKISPPSAESGVRFSDEETRTYQTTIDTMFQEFEEQVKQTTREIDALKREWSDVNAEMVTLQKRMLSDGPEIGLGDGQHQDGKKAMKTKAQKQRGVDDDIRQIIISDTRLAISKLTRDAMEQAEGEEQSIRAKEAEFRKQMMKNLQAMDL